jgi:hypothetical protein
MTWRTGRRVPITLYENDEVRGMLLDAGVAARVVATLNAGERYGFDDSWLVKDFNVLYRVALDVSESQIDPSRESPPFRNMRAQLERLKPAFTDTEEVRAYLRAKAGR